MRSTINNYYIKLRSTNILSNFLNLSSIQVSNILLLVITIRIITGRYGINGYGLVSVAYIFLMLASTVINYGTTQSGVRDTAYHINEPDKMSFVIYKAMGIRIVIFTLFCFALWAYRWLEPANYNYLWFAVPLAIAEVVNPLSFFIGVEKVKIFNIFNLIGNFFAVAVIFIFVRGAGNAIWVNFVLGTANVAVYTGLFLYFHKRFRLNFYLPSTADLVEIGKANFSLTLNNVSANLQQSVIFFAFDFFKSPLLGPYSVANRVIGQCRNALNIVTNAVYPKAVALYKTNEQQWISFRRKMKIIFSLSAVAGAMFIFVVADLVVFILSDKHDANTITILRIMAFVPVITAFNVFSMLDLLLKQKRRAIFNIAIVLMLVAAAVAGTAVYSKNIYLVAAFTLFIEGTAWLMYEYVIKTTKTQNA